MTRGFENAFAKPPAETPGEKAFREQEAIDREGVPSRARTAQGRAGARAIRRRGSDEGNPDEKEDKKGKGEDEDEAEGGGTEVDLTEELNRSI